MIKLTNYLKNETIGSGIISAKSEYYLEQEMLVLDTQEMDPPGCD